MSKHARTASIVLAFSLVAVSLPTLGQARAGGGDDVRSGRFLVNTCTSGEVVQANWCAAYLAGLGDALTAFGKDGNKGGLCDPEYQVGDLSDIYLSSTLAISGQALIQKCGSEAM
jgi:hypothetical protein